MSSNKNKFFPPRLSQDELDHLVDSLTDYSLAHGLVVRPVPSLAASNPNNALGTVAPITLWPCPFPRAPFGEAQAIQTTCNELYARIASDEEWLGSVAEKLAAVDDFMERLWRVHLDVKKAGGYSQKASLGMFRSDYMVHADPEGEKEPAIKQVEFNTIASSFGALSTRVSGLHRFLLESGAYPDTDIVKTESLPANPTLDKMADGLAAAHKHYLSQGDLHPSATTAAVAFIVQENERNAFDQRWLEYSLLENHGIRTYRLTFDEIPKVTTVDPETKRLLLNLPHFDSAPVEISTVYFRAGYGPADYTTDEDWKTRTQLEMSKAIKCPTILTQLAGSKKVQQLLCEPNTLSRFVADKQMAARIMKSFAAIYPLDDSPGGLKARKLAFEEPSKFVLKPQREGGGNNIYKEKIPGFLKSIPEDHWSGYILMELILPPSVENLVVRNGELTKGAVVGELGIYGVSVWEKDSLGNEGDASDVRVSVNFEAGHLLRTKGIESEEGGVAAGFGSISSVVLV